MSNGIQVRICQLVWVGGAAEGQAGMWEPVGDGLTALAVGIEQLVFEGSRITAGVSELRTRMQLLRDAGFPASAVIVLGYETGLDAATLNLMAARTRAVKDLLLAFGANAVNVAADQPSNLL